MQKILVATDFSPCSAAALELATGIARREGASLTLLHVCEVPSRWYYGGGVYVPPTELVADLKQDAEKGLATERERIVRHGVAADTKVLVGEVAHEIVEYAHDHQYDLIVLGTHGRRGVPRLFLGSVAERVVRAADVPVLTARLPATAQAAAEATQPG